MIIQACDSYLADPGRQIQIMTYLLVQLAGAGRCWARRIAKEHLDLGFVGAQIRRFRCHGSAHGNVEESRNQSYVAVKQ